MPVANCIITPECKSEASDLIELWAKESGISPEPMTINIISSNQQLGRKYSVIATLYLPSLWTSQKVKSLQVGLARALAKHFSLEISDVLVITNTVESGKVVEDGQEVHWSI